MNPVNVVIWLALVVGCALAKSTVDLGRIVGGENAEAGQFPHQVSIRNRFGNSHICGGAIISTRFILSAAHCIQDIRANITIHVVVGALYTSKGGIVMDLDKILAHQQYNEQTLKNDISLLRTVEDIIYSELVQPISLPTENPTIGGGLVVTISGWGTTIPPKFHNGGSSFPDTLQFVTAETLSLIECKKRIEGTLGAKLLTETNVCTKYREGRGACYGDSGGPLISKDKALVGIVSWGMGCAKGNPDFYTNVYSYLDWIHGEVAKLGGSLT